MGTDMTGLWDILGVAYKLKSEGNCTEELNEMRRLFPSKASFFNTNEEIAAYQPEAVL